MVSWFSFCILALVLSVNVVNCDDLLVGSTTNATPAYTETVKLSAVPFTSRVKNVFYTDDKNRVIKAVQAIDLDKSKAKPSITAGGVGATFVNIKLKGERGERLYYQVIIYV